MNATGSMTSTPTVDGELIDMMDAVFADYRLSHDPGPAETRVDCDRALWLRLDELGLVRLTGSEQSGGSGASWRESAELLTAAVRHGVRLPLAEHDLLACWLLEAVGHEVDGALRTIHVVPQPGAPRAPTPWAGSVDRIVTVWHGDDGYRVTDVDATEITIAPGHNLIGEPRDTVGVDATGWSGHAVAPDLVAQLKRKAALVRAIQVCAALDGAIAASVEHVMSRIQFGRPLAKFQAIQNLIADAAAEAAVARSATEAALNTALETGWLTNRLDFQIAVARSCAGHAASAVTRNAHQVHGAIGTTREHRLHEWTRAALAWRSESGSVHFWDRKVAAAAAEAGRTGMWALITGTG